MAKKRFIDNHKQVVKFFTIRYKHGFNDDENQLNYLNFKTKSYDTGTHNLNKKAYKLGVGLSMELGFEKKKLE